MPCEDDGTDTSDVAEVKECQRLPATIRSSERHETEHSLVPLEGTRPRPRLGLRLHSLQNSEARNLLLKPHSLRYFVTAFLQINESVITMNYEMSDFPPGNKDNFGYILLL